MGKTDLTYNPERYPLHICKITLNRVETANNVGQNSLVQMQSVTDVSGKKNPSKRIVAIENQVVRNIINPTETNITSYTDIPLTSQNTATNSLNNPFTYQQIAPENENQAGDAQQIAAEKMSFEFYSHISLGICEDEDRHVSTNTNATNATYDGVRLFGPTTSKGLDRRKFEMQS